MRTIYSLIIIIISSISLIGMGEANVSINTQQGMDNMLLQEVRDSKTLAYVDVVDHVQYNVTLYWLEEVVLSTTCKEEAILYMAQVNDEWANADIFTRLKVLTGKY